MVSLPFQKWAKITPIWYLLLVVGSFFFWLTSGPPPEHRDQLWRSRLYLYDDKYCDLSAVLAWMDLDHQGVDTRFHCPTCPCVASPMNYGAGVLWLGRLGLYRITPQGAYWLGPLLIAGFLAVLGWVLKEARGWQMPYYALLFFSPPMFLALQRANMDIVIFGLLALAVLVDQRYGNRWSYAAVWVAGALKYFPFIASIAFLRPTRRSLSYFGAALGATLLFIAATRSYIATARAPDVERSGWGLPASFKLLPATHAWSSSQILIAMLISVALVAIAGWIWRQPLQAALGGNTTPRVLFLAGSVVFAACFAIAGNFEYRSIFLLLLTPQLFWMSEQEGFVRHLGWLGLGATLAAFSLSWFKGNDWCEIGYQVSYWLLFGLCGTLSTAMASVTLLESLSVLAGQPVKAAPRKKAARATEKKLPTRQPAKPPSRREWRAHWPYVLIPCVVLAGGFIFYLVTIPNLGENLVDEPGFNEGAKAWTLGTPGWGGCTPAGWDFVSGHPGGAVILNSCGSPNNNPFAAQTITGLIPGRTYVLVFDWAMYSPTGVSGGGTGKSMGVFVDLSGTPASPADDKATMRPVFVGERGGVEYVTSEPIRFVATGPSVTIYFEGELDERTPGGPLKSTDVAYMIDNVELRMELRKGE